MAPSSGRTDQDVLASLAMLIIFVQINGGVGSLTMLSRGQLYVMNAGDSIELDCEFYTRYFNLFDNPVLWIKTQYHEASRINLMGNMNEPFVSTRRFRVTFLPSPPRFRLVLGIQGLSLEDSGNYTCEVRGPNTSVLAVVTHRLFIRAPVQDIILNKDNCTENCEPYTPSYLTFTEGDPSLLQCIATGGNPPPDMKIFLDDFDITYRFKTETYTRLLGIQGLRIMHSSVHTRTDNLVLSAQDDGKLLRCTATVPGLPINVTRSKVKVNYAPVITCEPNAALDNEKNVYVSCQVRSSPRATTLFWVIDANGTTLSEGQIVDEYWTLVQDRSDGVMETKLFMRRTLPQSFKKYTLVAENSVGIKREDVELIRKHPTGERIDNDTPYYGRRDYDHDPGSPHVDYIFIPAGAGQRRHLANAAIIWFSAFQMFVVQTVLLKRLC